MMGSQALTQPEGRMDCSYMSTEDEAKVMAEIRCNCQKVNAKKLMLKSRPMVDVEYG